MKCEQAQEAIVASWGEALPAEEDRALTRHLTDCAECREETDAMAELWRSLEGLAPEVDVPSERLRAKFYAGLLRQQERPVEGRRAQRVRSWWMGFWSRPLPAVGALSAAALVGVVLGGLWWGPRQTPGVDDLRAEVVAMRQIVVLSLLEHQSAAERLRGVSWSQAGSHDPRVEEALIQTLSYDPNANVRLAALNALAGSIERPGVRTALAQSLGRQRSPLVQMGLVEVLLSQPSGESEEAFRTLLATENLDELVRQRLVEAGGRTY